MAKVVCAGCAKNVVASLQCPTCLKKNLPAAYFCSQECYSASWANHKLIHAAQPKKVNGGERLIDERFAGFFFTGEMRPYTLSPKRHVPPEIGRPDYADDPDGEPKGEREAKAARIKVHNAEEIQGVREACILGRKILDLAGTMIQPGITTDAIDKACHKAIIKAGAYPSPLNYRGFPKSICTSINEVICHGIPDSRRLEEGDIVNVDVCVYLNGYHADLNETFFVGKCSEEAQKLVQVTYESLQQAIEACKPGMLYRDIGGVITKHVHQNGFSVVKAYCGHGVGNLLHTVPNVPHYQRNKAVGTMAPGHIFTIEPMINVGTWRDVLWPDNWTSTTKDGKLSAQFEHTLLITETGVEVLTARTKGSYKYSWLKNPTNNNTGTATKSKKKKRKRNRKKTNQAS
eukprot:TRINITY_DN392_c0_g1_i1.p1 TRINITY_DN392_c0_g1~~TRINITY_DN392_c0_g1_i1.p1  ORF type:complete len:413 (-),score=60.06 TRINITY_DN392_c0_g1_i1:44-1249(-)